MTAINAHYMRLADDQRLLELVCELQAEQGEAFSDRDREALSRAIPVVKEAAKTLLDLPRLAAFALKARPFRLDEKTRAMLTPEAHGRLQRLRARLEGAPGWTAGELARLVKDFAAEEGVGLGVIGPVLRGVLSGGAAAPDLGSTLFALRREEALGRIDDALSRPA
jgi:glutamyl-tRNA synthetase